MTLVQLRHFVALAEAGSFSKAAGRVFLTQPALSRSIQSLEDEWGAPLFDRVGRRIELTTYGREAQPRARRLL
ncbi:MAG: LysR family transcriptional regulator [Burkholderiaceae bacterium]